MKRILTNPYPGHPSRKTGAPDPDPAAGILPGGLRVDDCELRFQNGEMSVTFRLSLPASDPTSRRVPPRPTKSKS